jgi:hypothetical protein
MVMPRFVSPLPRVGRACSQRFPGGGWAITSSIAWSAGLVMMLLGQPAAAREAIIETLDGRTHRGEAALTNNSIVMDGTNVTVLEQLRRLNFDVPPAPGGPGRGKGNGLLGYYFGRTNFQGSVIVRLDEQVDFDWATGEPSPGVPADRFSVIWSGDVEPPVDGDYTFSIEADDVAELLVASNVVARLAPLQRGVAAFAKAVPLQATNRYPLLLRYQEFTGHAGIKLYWTGPGLTRRLVPHDRLYAKSRLPMHTSELLPDDGLLATYYRNPDFTGESFTRVDPKIDFNWIDRDPAAGFARGSYAVRWQGQLRADFTETYTFHVVGDEPMRVWLEGRPLILPTGQYYMTEVRESVPLTKGELYDLRVEGQSTGGNASMKLMWSSPSTPKNVIPPSHLQPLSSLAGPTATPGTGSAPGRPVRFPRGFVLANGSFIAVPVERASESVVRAGRWLQSNPISTINVARIYCQPVSKAMVDRIPRGRAGLLLAKGDFVDGDFRSWENGQVRLGSVLFGVKTYDANKDVLVVVLREVRPRAMEFEIRLQDHSVIAAESLQLEMAGVRFSEPALGAGRVEWPDVMGLHRIGAKRP